ncbi:SMI1/KNR4 family protein [Hafnia alvei]|uniref:SMI1-KNR4 cell-wall n=1 Tax=Hafnia alvei TaxID=569 RepID=A0A1C6YVD4_HAFAL|nr:SMI1/KNR4 family protein [Hafnia alvei]NLS55858.1 hypothetical protein [Hafnia alvei]SCM50830.1 SMI1-KNR4 cell-wall [Hafnia alvei]
MNTYSFELLSPYAKSGKEIYQCKKSSSAEQYFPNDYLELLSRYDGGIFFRNGARIKTKIEIPIISNGYVSIIFLFGLTQDNYGINYIVNHLPADIPPGYIPIAECDWGDFICFEINSGKIFYWWHEALYESECFYLLENDINEFITHLEPEEHDDNETGFNGSVAMFKELLEKPSTKN